MSSGRDFICLYGPPGSGKSSVGRALAARLGFPFWDLDEEIQVRSKMNIPEIFAREGEKGFRRRERKVLLDLLAHQEGVLALGGGALLNPANLTQVEAAGTVLCLQAPIERLLERLGAESNSRPLLNGDLRPRLESLLSSRADHYNSFPFALDADWPVERIVRDAQIRIGKFRVSGMGQAYDVIVQESGLDGIGDLLLKRGLRSPVIVVSDENVGSLYTQQVLDSLQSANYRAHSITIPPGEQHKNLHTVASLWEGFLAAGIERSSTVIALGGGVVGDLAGFAASTILRGVPWVALPTTLLAMADASLGGKTGFDLPQGKNLVGAFHSPRLVLADPHTLETLPSAELRAGMAEVVKSGLVGDAELFALCGRGWEAVERDLGEVVRRAMAVKISVIEDDPYEKGRRAALNLGHTFGHAVELASGFQLRHGEAIAIGLVAEARLAEKIGIAETGLTGEIEGVLRALGLPVEIPPELDRVAVREVMQVDKKRLDGRVRFALPIRPGEVKVGVVVDFTELSI